MIKMLKSKGRLLLFMMLTLCSSLLLGSAKLDSKVKSISLDKNQAIIENIIDCNSHLYKDSDASWRKILHKNPMFILRIETSQ